jgi:choice-of-anchor A domain-containing protein
MFKSLLCLALAGVAAPVAAETAAQDGMQLLKQFNVITLDNLNVNNTQHVQGKVFVGGNLNGGLNVAQSATGSATASDYAELTVGGNVGGWNVDHSQTIGRGALVQVGGNSGQATMNTNGHVDVGGTFNSQGFNPNATKTISTGVAGLASAIAAQRTTFSTDLHALSNELAALPSASIANMNQSLSFAGDYAIYTMNAAQFGTSNYDFKTLFSGVAANQTVVINVLGSALNIGGGSNFNAPGGDGANILWNFNQAQTVNIGNWYGSILAPDATLTTSNGNITGSVVSRIFNESGEVHLATFGGTSRYLVTTPDNPPGAVPEPASWMTMLLGFGVSGSIIRRRRRKENLVAA